MYLKWVNIIFIEKRKVQLYKAYIYRHTPVPDNLLNRQKSTENGMIYHRFTARIKS